VWNISTFLDCRNGLQPNQAGAQWVNLNGGHSGNNPCNIKSFGTDPLTGTSALIFAPDASTNDVTGIQTAGDCTTTANTCYAIYPITNLYAEINWRFDPNAPVIFHDFYAFQLQTAAGFGCLEVDFVEWFTNLNATGGGSLPYANCGGNNNNELGIFPLDANYHTDSDLATGTNAGGGTVNVCYYNDGRAGIANRACSLASPVATPLEEGTLNIWGLSGDGVHTMFLYIAWIRIWSCSGWTTTGNPYTTNNTCNTPNPPTTAP
jgi:hypothetical protein